MAWRISAAVAAALALVFFLWTARGNDSLEWQLVSTGESGISGFVHNPGPEALQVEVENSLRWRLMPGTSVRFSKPTAGQPLEVFVDSGTALATTGPDFPQAGLVVNCRFLDVRITGTTFGILAGTDSTCVCVLEGVVQTGAGEPIPSGSVLTQYEELTTTAVLGPAHRSLLEDLAKTY